jgi:hypothetical protein
LGTPLVRKNEEHIGARTRMRKRSCKTHSLESETGSSGTSPLQKSSSFHYSSLRSTFVFVQRN